MNAASSVDDPTSRWRDRFGDCPPAGYWCRDAFPELWFRIHSLPGSKRYPSAPSEYAELLRRHNAVATSILGEGEACFVYARFISDTAEPSGAPERVDHLRQPLLWQPNLSVVEDDEVPAWLHFAAARIEWASSRFDTSICAVADEASSPLLFFNAVRQTIYAPYDGGADLFLSSSQDRDAAKRRWQHWLSARPDGL